MAAVHPGSGIREMSIDGRRYAVNVELIWKTTFGDGLVIRTVPPWLVAVDRCESCGRSDLQERVARSFEQAVEFGWLSPLEDPSPSA
jgi:hypothetical protein